MNQILKPKMTTTFLKRTALAAVLGFTSLAALAIPSDRQQPISLVADRATFNERTGITTYTGNVIIEQGTMKLQANSIVANLNSKKQISTITALHVSSNRSMLLKELRKVRHRRLSTMLIPVLLP
jgi:lipopolysaccharide export system protein LptA